MSHYKKVLFATDLIEDHHDTAVKAAALARDFKAELHLVHCVEPIPAYGYIGVTDITSPHIDHAKEALAHLGSELQVAEANQKILVGPPKQMIMETAAEVGADLIMVGSHVKHGLDWLLGSTANAVIHSSPCDVLVIRTQD